jgi:hypothetical protein
MSKYCSYDAENNFILWELKNTPYTAEAHAQAYLELIEVAKSLPKKPYILVDWTDFTPFGLNQDFYRPYVSELVKHIRGLVRCNVVRPDIRIALRKDAINSSLEDTRFFFYPSREAALEAIRNGEIK